ncbi:hypothetical protein [Rhizobium sp.]|jgi:uncharacterized protein|uniref:hypothetical protein n=1 Tax=Rhizobium sp. TaxID=391 RepID=UPI000E80DDB0|nr:hypothetical protein [Rhizobium sp.]
MTCPAPKPVPCFRADGTTFDLISPHPSEISVETIAGPLSRINRFNGTSYAGYSVAQHCVMGAEALLNEGAEPIVAAFFLLHDAHEALLGDWTRPAQDAIIARMCVIANDSTTAIVFKNAMFSLKCDWDAAIYSAFDLPRPAIWTKADTAAVKRMDNMMLAAEARALFPLGHELYPLAKFPQPKLRGAITPWGAAKAEERFINLASQLIGQDRIDAARLNHLAHISKPAKRR